MPPKARTPAKRTTTRKTAAAKPAAKKAPAKRPGRPRKLEIDPVLLKAITDYVELGVFPERAAVAAGISERSHYGWQAKGLEERDRRDAANPDEPPRPDYQVFLDYVDAIDKATAVAEIDLLKKARGTGDDRVGALAILERRFRDRWGAKATGPAPARTTGVAATTPLGQLDERRRQREQAAR